MTLRHMKRLPGGLLPALLLGLLSGAVKAQEPAGLQAATTARLEGLERRLLLLQQALANSGGESARAQAARDVLLAKRIRERMQQAQTLLQAGRWDEAAELAMSLRRDLGDVLQALLRPASKTPDRVAGIQQLAAMRDQVAGMRQQQERLAEAAEDLAQGTGSAEDGSPGAASPATMTPEEAAAQQRRLADQARAMAAAMAQQGASAPGQQSVADAVDPMEQAQGKLAQGDPAGAREAQKEALEQLADAERQLEQALAEQQEALRDQLRAELASSLGEMLAEQQRIRGETQRMESELRDGDSEQRRLQLVQLAKDQGALASRSGALREGLVADGTTAVIPDLLGDLTGLFQQAAERLGRGGSGPGVRAIQLEAEQLMDAIAAGLEGAGSGEEEGGQQPSGDSGSGDDGLVPVAAELRVLLGLQERINLQTVELDRAERGQRALHRRGLERLVAAQQRVRQLSRSLAERIAREARAAPIPGAVEQEEKR